MPRACSARRLPGCHRRLPGVRVNWGDRLRLVAPQCLIACDNLFAPLGRHARCNGRETRQQSLPCLWREGRRLHGLGQAGQGPIRRGRCHLERGRGCRPSLRGCDSLRLTETIACQFGKHAFRETCQVSAQISRLTAVSQDVPEQGLDLGRGTGARRGGRTGSGHRPEVELALERGTVPRHQLLGRCDAPPGGPEREGTPHTRPETPHPLDPSRTQVTSVRPMLPPRVLSPPKYHAQAPHFAAGRAGARQSPKQILVQRFRPNKLRSVQFDTN
jgi:hypothetical protein